MISDTKEIFAQLADADGAAGVQAIIENHDAWVNNEGVQRAITAAMRVQLERAPRGEVVARKIARQRESLAGLVTGVAGRMSSAG